MITGMELFSGYMILYTLSFGIAVFFLLLSITGIGGEHEVGHDISHDFDHDIDHDLDHDVDHGSSGESIFNSFLSLLGVKKCPFSIVMMMFFLFFTLFGFITVIILKPILITPYIFAPICYVTSLILSFILTGRLAGLIGKFMPSKETYVQRSTALIGKIGKAIYTFKNNKGYI